MARLYFVVFFFCILNLCFGQTNHYETLVYESDEWNYFIGNLEPPSDWGTLNFDDQNWLKGQGGFGYGDNDDRTIIPETTSLYIRREFTLIDKSMLTSLFLDIDYDDAFVAYLNGIEIGRKGVDGNPPTHDETGENHEAFIKDGGLPERFWIEDSIFENTLKNGKNVLAIQVHNQSINSTDFSARPFLSAGISISDKIYGDTHPYFQKPLIFESSNLPILIIETENKAEIVDEPKVKAQLSIIHDEINEMNLITDIPNIYNGNIGIEIRGNYSSGLPQKPYGFETRDDDDENLDVPILHMPEENDWILLANYNDKVMMRNTLSFHLFSEMGHYAPRTQYCEVMLNNSYEGIYLLTEKIKQDDGRVDIANLKAEDIEGDELTGGYIFKNDYFEQDWSDSWMGDFSPESLPNKRVFFVYHDPKANKIEIEQKRYIQDFVRGFETALFGSNFKDPETGYRAYINVSSFIDYLIISELSRNADAYKKSKYYFKDKESKGGLLNSGPVWDFDWAFKNFNGRRTDGSGWAHLSTENMYPTPNGWIERMLKDPWFTNQLGNRYHSLRDSILSERYINNFIDDQYNILSEATSRHYQRWPILGINVGTPEGNEPQPPSFEGEVSKFKNWIRIRLNWLDANMPAANTSSTAEAKTNLNVRVFPNPTTDYLFVEANSPIKNLAIWDAKGQLIKSTEMGSNRSRKISLIGLSKGIYFVNLNLENTETRIVRIVKE